MIIKKLMGQIKEYKKINDKLRKRLAKKRQKNDQN